MVEEPKQFRPARFVFRVTASLGVGLALAAVWWEYSDQIIKTYLPAFLGG